ncbi:hypothetical protein C8J56DRAFT_1043720 [Mycena floridula]|nr:hypothetical protein C8J56DRAFT_1043720 [Mycena floridula]
MLEKSDFERQIAVLDEQIAVHQQTVEPLTHRREKTMETFVSPVRRVPAEIIGEIVNLALSDGKGSLQLVICEGRALGLWAMSPIAIVVRILRPSLKILQRSTDHQPRQLKLRAIADLTVGRELLTVVIEHSPLFTHLDLALIPKLLPRLKKLKDRTQSLQRLRIEACTRDFANPSPLIECFRDAPSLRSVTLVQLRNVLLLNLPWNQLNEFHSRSRVFGGSSEISLRNLCTFGVFNPFASSPLALLSVLHLPALCELKVYATELHRDSGAHPAIVLFIKAFMLENISRW